MGTNSGQACSWTSIPASREWTARLYAPLAAVSGVASTPTRLLRVSSTAARAPGSMTPMIGTSKDRCVALRAEAVAVLHAITISFTFMPMR